MKDEYWVYIICLVIVGIIIAIDQTSIVKRNKKFWANHFNWFLFALCVGIFLYPFECYLLIIAVDVYKLHKVKIKQNKDGVM